MHHQNTWAGTMADYTVWGQTLYSYQDDTKPWLNLDRDNVWGGGIPETTTFYMMNSCEFDCKFVFRVWDYCSMNQALEHASEAVVRLYNSEGLHSTYNIGAQGLINFEDYNRVSAFTGDPLYKNRWDVFQIDATGGAVVVEDCSSGNCPQDATDAGWNHGWCNDDPASGLVRED
jgi:hypothetical protein